MRLFSLTSACTRLSVVVSNVSVVSDVSVSVFSGGGNVSVSVFSGGGLLSKGAGKRYWSAWDWLDGYVCSGDCG